MQASILMLDRKFLAENSLLATHTGTGTIVLYEMLR